ncbi:MAG: histidine kinase [Chitinophagaceae bacterium]
MQNQFFRMSSHDKKLCSFLLLVLFFFLPNKIYSQSKCDCPEYAIAKSEEGKSSFGNKFAQQKLLSSANTICTAKSYEWMANDYLEENSFDTAEIYFKKAEKLYKQSGCADSILLSTYKYWAQLHYTKGDFPKAQEYTFKLLQSAESSGNPHEIAGCYTMIAQLFNQTDQAGKGIVYARLAIPLLKKIDNPQKKADILFKLSKRYLWHYQDTKTATSLDSSELFSYEQLAIAKQIGRKSSIAVAFSNLQGIAYERNDLKKALQLLDSSFQYTDSDNYDNLGTNYYDKADILIELKEYHAAARMADSSMYYRKLDSNPAYIAEIYDLLLSRIAKESGNFEKAYEYKELGRIITDSIRNAEKAKQVTELERKYSQAKNEKKIEELAQQRRTYLLLAVAGLLGLVALTFFIRQQSLKSKQTILETEQRLNRARMNPHFFFNALSALQSFALLENDGKALASNLSKFSHIMRETLESTYKEYVTIEQEKDFLNEYLELQKMRFPMKFSYEIEIGEDIDADELMIPSMILQPFVENSIEHGFTGINYPGHVSIQFNKEANDLQITITDNGKGLLQSVKENNDHISRASQIIKDRIYLLNIKLKTRARFSIDSNAEGNGVTVKIFLPLLDKQAIS